MANNPKNNESAINTNSGIKKVWSNRTKEENNQLFLEKVRRKSVDEVRQMIEKHSNGSLELDLNCETTEGNNALWIAVENHHYNMCELLLEKQVRINCAILRAIELSYVDIVSLMLEHDKTLRDAVSQDSENVQMLLKETEDEYSWEIHILKQVFYKAIASPDYIIAMSELERQEQDPFLFCLRLIKYIQHDISYNVDRLEFYESLCEQIEDFMCKLLDQIKSTSELNNLFDWLSTNFNDSILGGAESKIYKQIQAKPLSLVEKACNLKLVKFVTHENCQFMLSKLLKRNIPVFGKGLIALEFIRSQCLGLIFFIWPFLSFFPPWKPLGRIITSPIVMYKSHMMSYLTFLALLIAYVATKAPENEYLGSPPTTLEWLIFVLVVARVVGECQEGNKRGFKVCLTDWWKLFDLIPLALFFAAIVTRIADFFMHVYDVPKTYRSNWSSTNLRQISVGLLSVAYIFAFMKALRFTRTSRLLGTLRVSLVKMAFNILQFFAIFFLMMLAFTISFTELYWYSGTVDGMGVFCSSKNNITGLFCPTPDGSVENTCTGPIFTSVVTTLVDLFWALFGQLEIQCLRKLRPGDNYIDDTGIFLMGIYHICIIFILLNMLIAMMSESFANTSERKDAEFKFYRTDIWIRFIRQDYAAPPPWNLLPDFYNVFVKMRKMIFLGCCCENSTSRQFSVQVKSFDDAVKEVYAKQNMGHVQVSKELMMRYKAEYLL